MARQEVSYVCEDCGAKFNTLEKAQGCESQHFRIVDFTKVVYDLSENNKRKFPTSINVKLRDYDGKEKTITYFRHL